MNQDNQNLNLLSIFHYILGGLVILWLFFFLCYIGIGIAFLHGTFDGNSAPPPAFGWMFVIMGSIAVIFGGTIGTLMIISGLKIKARKSRTFCIVIAAIECLITPLGTILGVFTIVILTKESVIKLFEPNVNTRTQYDL